MMKSLFVIVTLVLIALALAHETVEDTERQHHHKGQHAAHSPQNSSPHNGHSITHGKLHRGHALGQEKEKEHSKHGPIPVPLAPHHSKHKRNGRRHHNSKTAKNPRNSKNHPHQVKLGHKKHQAQKAHGHGHARKHL